eukprot:CAMPEP_0194273188 /NCGR_PEP_ID=MMETSP0169-20130528/6582_1 /TAXON_ID=218684 /ORGANISM="Corethron pennatum, Strain L29A3" /LENGTH=328 /DNA_ID=CAMNT_0039016067 /DNA_START=49 /DNA_END=1035 /DNA_ORIENTATION=-
MHRRAGASKAAYAAARKKREASSAAVAASESGDSTGKSANPSTQTVRPSPSVQYGASDPFEAKSRQIEAKALESAKYLIEKLQREVGKFAQKHADDIRTDPAFRAEFLRMCAPLGIDPLAAAARSSTNSGKSFWSKALFGQDMSDFYYGLSVRVAEICIATRPRNGGIISLSELHTAVVQRERRGVGGRFNFGKTDQGGQKGLKKEDKIRKISEDDVLIALSKLGKLGSGFRTITVGDSTMVLSVPQELDGDHMRAMEAAQDAASPGAVTADEVVAATGWDNARAARALDLLLTNGMAWIDLDASGRKTYWFPSIWREGAELSSSEAI